MRDPAPYRAGDTPHQSSALEIGWTCWMRATGMVVNTGHLRGCLAYRGWLRTPDVGCTLVLHLSDLDARQRSANGSGEVVMASSIGPALVGLGGVIIGGGMTMVNVCFGMKRRDDLHFLNFFISLGGSTIASMK